jgi:uncharacterized membrane protein required for colicin V production
MVLDIALGVVVLLWAIRGWFKGFLIQAIGLTALVGGVYAAVPLREAVRPHAQKYLPTIEAGVLDRLLWWGLLGTFVLIVGGIGGWLVRLNRRRSLVPGEPNRADQGAGFVLGALKGAVAACFLVAAVERFVPEELRKAGPVEETTKNSKALAWSMQHHPAERIWGQPSVQAVVAEVRRHGLGQDVETPAEPGAEAKPDLVDTPAGDQGRKGEGDPLRTARRTPNLRVLGPAGTPLTGSPEFLERLDRQVEALDRAIRGSW